MQQILVSAEDDSEKNFIFFKEFEGAKNVDVLEVFLKDVKDIGTLSILHIWCFIFWK